MVPPLPRSARIPLKIPLTYRTAGDDHWLLGQVYNISESGVLFGPTDLSSGASVEMIFSSPIPIGTVGAGKQICVAKVVRTTEVGHAAARFEECRLLLEA